MIDPSLVPPPVDPTATVPLDPAFEDKRKRIAQALMMQRGMGKPTPMGNFANSALAAWNMARKNPGLQPTPRQPITPPNPMDAGYPIDTIGGG